MERSTPVILLQSVDNTRNPNKKSAPKGHEKSNPHGRKTKHPEPVLLMATRHPEDVATGWICKTNHKVWNKPPFPQLVIAGFLNHQQYFMMSSCQVFNKLTDLISGHVAFVKKIKY